MNMKYFLSGLVLISTLLISCKKNESSDSGKSVMLYGHYTAICGNSKNEILIFGYETTDQDTSLIVLKTDLDGKQIWEQRYLCEYLTRPIAALATENNEYFVAADRQIGKNNIVYGYEHLLLKLDDNGDTIYQVLLEESWNMMTTEMIFSRNKGVLVMLVGMSDRNPKLIEVSATGEVLTKTTFDIPPHIFRIGEYPAGSRYLMCNDQHGFDSLKLNVCQFDLSGEIISYYTLVRENLAGNTCFASEEQNVIWLSAVDHGIRMTKTDLANHVTREEIFPVPNSQVAIIEGIKKIDASNYAFGHDRRDNDGSYHLFVLKFNGTGDMEKIFLTPLGSLSPTSYNFTGLDNGRLAVIHYVHDDNECLDGGCYALNIYN